MFKPVLPIACLLLAACSTVGKVTPLTSTGGATRATNMALNVHGQCEAAAQCEELRGALASRLVGASMAERIVAAGQPADLSLDVQVDRNGTVLRSFRVESASASHPFSGESNQSDAYRQFASDTITALR